MTSPRLLIADSFRNLRFSWQKLVLTAVAYKLLAVIVLTPCVGILFRLGLAVSGSEVLADQDILFFCFGPVGLMCLILVGGVWLSIAALEQSALLAVLASGEPPQISIPGALRFAAANAWPVLKVTARIIAVTLLTAAPFLIVATAVYFALLTEHDINFYLKQKPPVFLIAVGIGVVILISLAVVLLHLFTRWFLALPLTLFERMPPAQALGLSRERTIGQRRALLLWVLAWALATTALSLAATTTVIGLGRLIVPRTVGYPALMSFTVGVFLLLWIVISLIVNLLSTTVLSVLIFRVYRQLGGTSLQSTLPDVTERAVVNGPGFRLTRNRMLAAGCLGFVAATAIGIFTVQSVRLKDQVVVMAHRGSSKAAPENTMAAVRQAIEDGADWVEIDVQETADGEVVVFHDSDFMRQSRTSLKIWEATSDDLQTIDIGSWFAPEFKDERVPALRDVLELCRGKIGVNIELKYYGHDKQLEQRVAQIVEECRMVPHIVVMSLKIDAVRRMKQIRPDWKVGLLLSVHAGNLKKLDADFVAVNAGFVDRRFVRAAQASGKEVYVWTVNDAVSMSNMIGRGVDALITDRPALARSVIERRARMSAPERLLLELAEMFGVSPQIGEQ